jgi:hypothetical protein
MAWWRRHLAIKPSARPVARLNPGLIEPELRLVLFISVISKSSGDYT